MLLPSSNPNFVRPPPAATRLRIRTASVMCPSSSFSGVMTIFVVSTLTLAELIILKLTSCQGYHRSHTDFMCWKLSLFIPPAQKERLTEFQEHLMIKRTFLSCSVQILVVILSVKLVAFLTADFFLPSLATPSTLC